MDARLPFTTPEYIAEPYAYWDKLRDETPVYWSEANRFWAVSRYDDVLEVLHDPKLFSSAGGPVGTIDGASGAPRLPMLQDDPPHHDRLRRILSKAFVPRTTAEREGRIREIAEELLNDVLARVDAGKEIDLVRDFSSPFPVRVIAEMLGIPGELHDQLRMWNASTSVTGTADMTEAQSPHTMRDMAETLGQLIEERRSDRRDDLFSALIAASESDESPLRPDELVGVCQLLWIAGNETTTNMLSNAALVLQDRRDLLELVQTRPGDLPALVEEFLRLESPVNCLARTATDDVEFRGEKIHAGDNVMMIFASANRDPRHFDRPNEVILDRRPNDHIALSHGIHFCLGSHLARLESRVGIEALGQLLPRVRLRPEAGARIPIAILRGWLRLPVEVVG